MIENPMLSVVALSVAVNFLALPLYRKADMMQTKEIEKTAKMKPMLDHIRKTFSGDERFLIQTAYYRVEHYNPLNILKEVGPLLLQIPFFIAAYRYISTLPQMEGASFGPIANLLMPDGLIRFSGISINILPVIMTVINCASGYVYSQGAPLRQRIQIYSMAAVFLLLLYNSASGLVIYWIMNQFFSLGKNLIYKKKISNTELMPAAGAVIMILLIVLGMALQTINSNLDVLAAECILIFSVYIIIRAVVSLNHIEIPTALKRFSAYFRTDTDRSVFPIVIMIEICLALLMGVFIPSSVISSSVIEFMDQTTGSFQVGLLTYPALLYSGLFLIWLTVIIISNEKQKVPLAAILWMFMGISLVNQFLFDPNTGSLYTDLTFDGSLRFTSIQIILNISACIIVAFTSVLIFVKRPQWVMRITALITAAIFCLSVTNIVHIFSELKQVKEQSYNVTESDEIIRLSRNGRNVVVIMMDRAIGGFAPFIFDEKPELKDSFRGFTYYPNTISLGGWTIFGAPGLFGGYEYTPAEMNKREDVLLKDKHNEALLLMPIIFADNGYHVMICDPPMPNYSTITDYSIFDIYPYVDTFRLSGNYTSALSASLRSGIEDRQKHNFTAHSLFRIVPLIIKNDVYDNGDYHKIDSGNHYTQAFLNEYSVLDALPSITAVTNEPGDNLILFQNATPHEPVALNPPDYLVDGQSGDDSFQGGTRSVDGFTMRISDTSDWEHYCVNVASYQKFAQWLDYLKEQGVYDNTRIIITSDHGYSLGQFDSLLHPEGLDVEGYWSLLLVKDFDAEEPLSSNMDFMTNADTPLIAMKGIIDNPINPFTENPVNDDLKISGQLLVTDSLHHFIVQNPGTIFNTKDAHWWSVHDSIFDMNNWRMVPDEEVNSN